MSGLIPTTLGYWAAIGITIVVFALYGAKSWLHTKCKALLAENESNATSMSLSPQTDSPKERTKEQQPFRRNQYYFTSQIFPRSTLQLQIYVTTIDHYYVAIKTPLIQIAILFLLYTYSASELVVNYNSSNYLYNIIFHSIQLFSLISFYFVSNLNPGIIQPHPAINDNATYKEIGGDKNDDDAEAEEKEKDDITTKETDKLLIDSGYHTNNSNTNNEHKIPKSLERLIGSGRYSKIRKRTKSQLHEINNTHPIEIECEWNNDSTVPVSYCYNCYFLHPIRAKHCYELGFCVARYDHYCKLIENAVGAYNLRYVIFNLLLDSVIFVWELCMTVYIMISSISNSFDDISGWILLVFLALYLLIASLTRTIHLFDHIQTISKNQTISEKVDPQRVVDVLNDGYHDYDEDDREIDYHERYFDEGFLKNWWLCLTQYRENNEYFNGIKCKLVFDDDDDDHDHDHGRYDTTLFLQ